MRPDASVLICDQDARHPEIPPEGGARVFEEHYRVSIPLKYPQFCVTMKKT